MRPLPGGGTGPSRDSGNLQRRWICHWNGEALVFDARCGGHCRTREGIDGSGEHVAGGAEVCFAAGAGFGGGPAFDKHLVVREAVAGTESAGRLTGGTGIAFSVVDPPTAGLRARPGAGPTSCHESSVT